MNNFEIGPFLEFPLVHVDYSNNSLVQTLVEYLAPEVKETPQPSFKQWVLYFLFLYDFPKEERFEEFRVIGKKTLAERVNGFRVVEREKNYYVQYN